MARTFSGRSDMEDDLHRILDLLHGDEPPAPAECAPPCDVVETADGLEVTIDLPGVSSSDVQVAFRDNVLIVSGRKLPAACQHGEAAFHLAERTFGRFVRAVQVAGAYDAGAAQATLRAGELHVRLPRIDERRGREIRVPVQAD